MLNLEEFPYVLTAIFCIFYTIPFYFNIIIYYSYLKNKNHYSKNNNKKNSNNIDYSTLFEPNKPL